jgi:Tol biopolymer transport system component
MVQLTWFGRAGQRLGVVEQPTPILLATDALSNPLSLSPDGKRVATTRIDPLTRRRDLWVSDVARNTAARVTNDGSAGTLAWAPDGTRLAFDSNRRTGDGDLFVTPSDGNGVQKSLLISNSNKFVSDWSRDGRLVLFEVQEGPNAVLNIWVLPLNDGTAPWPYVQNAYNKNEPRFSPDTRWVTYDSDESGRSEVYVQSFPQPNTRHQISADGGRSARWRRDGRELFYVTPQGTLMAVPIKLTPTFDMGSASPLFSIPNAASQDVVAYDVQPDGQRFLVADVVRGEMRSPITVVLNWTASLKR